MLQRIIPLPPNGRPAGPFPSTGPAVIIAGMFSACARTRPSFTCEAFSVSVDVGLSNRASPISHSFLTASSISTGIGVSFFCFCFAIRSVFTVWPAVGGTLLNQPEAAPAILLLQQRPGAFLAGPGSAYLYQHLQWIRRFSWFLTVVDVACPALLGSIARVHVCACAAIFSPPKSITRSHSHSTLFSANFSTARHFKTQPTFCIFLKPTRVIHPLATDDPPCSLPSFGTSQKLRKLTKTPSPAPLILVSLLSPFFVGSWSLISPLL
jgi:hypothetical protein